MRILNPVCPLKCTSDCSFEYRPEPLASFSDASVRLVMVDGTIEEGAKPINPLHRRPGLKPAVGNDPLPCQHFFAITVSGVILLRSNRWDRYSASSVY